MLIFKQLFAFLKHALPLRKEKSSPITKKFVINFVNIYKSFFQLCGVRYGAVPSACFPKSGFLMIAQLNSKPGLKQNLQLEVNKYEVACILLSMLRKIIRCLYLIRQNKYQNDKNNVTLKIFVCLNLKQCLHYGDYRSKLEPIKNVKNIFLFIKRHQHRFEMYITRCNVVGKSWGPILQHL